MLEKGRDKEEMIPEADNQTGITAKISKNFEIDFESFFDDLQIFSHQKIKELQLQNTHS